MLFSISGRRRAHGTSPKLELTHVDCLSPASEVTPQLKHPTPATPPTSVVGTAWVTCWTLSLRSTPSSHPGALSHILCFFLCATSRLARLVPVPCISLSDNHATASPSSMHFFTLFPPPLNLPVGGWGVFSLTHRKRAQKLNCSAQSQVFLSLGIFISHPFLLF